MKKINEIINKTSPLMLKEFAPMVWEAKYGYYFWICWRYVGTEKWHAIELAEDYDDEKYFWRLSKQWAAIDCNRYIKRLRKAQSQELEKVA